jgi:hypothetical protein
MGRWCAAAKVPPLPLLNDPHDWLGEWRRRYSMDATLSNPNDRHSLRTASF